MRLLVFVLIWKGITGCLKNESKTIKYVNIIKSVPGKTKQFESMIRIIINGRKYKGVYRWEDMSLQRFCNLAAIPMPECYEAYILADGKFSAENIDSYIEAVSKITDKQIKEDFPVYYRKVIECLTNIPYKKIALLSSEQAGDLYDYYFKPFVISLLYHVPVIHFMGQVKQYEPPFMNSFRIGLNLFRLPVTVNIMDQDIPLANEPIITYTEASDIFRGMKVSKDDVKRLALFMSIYCRKKGEKYNQKKALERQELFMKAPMSVVWSVFFYTARRLTGSSGITQLFGSLPKAIHEVKTMVQDYKSMAVLD
jgi:hypothetical protein